LGEIAIAIAIGAAIGLVTARRIAMTAMPQLVAAFHSLVGMAAVLVAAAAYLNPEAFGIAEGGIIDPVSRLEMGLGAAIGAITFSGSVIAFLKLNGNMSGKPIMLPMRHVINLGTLALILGLTAYFTQDQSPWVFWTVVALSFLIGFLLIIPIGGADMPVVVSMLNSYSGWAAAAMGFTLQNSAMIITGALVGSSGAILSYIMCRAMNRSFISVIAGGFGGDAAAAGAAGGAIDRPLQAGLGGRRRLPDESGRAGDHRPRLRHGGGAGPACAPGDGRPPQEGGRQRQIRHPPGGGPHAGPHERPPRRSQCAL
jgi:NAD(P) transhydrogenase subunit beta